MSKVDSRIARSAAALEAFSRPVLANPEAYAAVKVARVQQGITAAELASFAGVSLRTVARAEAGDSVGRLSEQRIAHALGQDQAVLFA